MNINFPQQRPSAEALGALKRDLAGGDTVKGRVVKSLGGNRYQVNVRGSMVTVEGKGPLTMGSIIVLLVEEVKDQIYTKLLGTADAADNKSDLKQILRNLGFSASRGNLAILGRLLELNVVFDRGLFGYLQEILTSLGHGTLEQRLELGLVMASRQLPITPAVLAALWCVLYQPEYFNRQLGLLRDRLRQLIKSTGSDTKGGRTLRNGLEFLDGFHCELPAEDLAERIREQISKSGIFFEDRLLKGRTGREDLKQWLLRLSSELVSLPMTGRSDIGRVRDLIQKLLHYIEGEQLFCQDTAAGQEVFACLAILNGQAIRECQVRLQCPHKTDQDKRTSIHLAIKTENLGTVKVGVDILKKILNCRFKLESEKAAAFLNKHSGDLREILDELPYTVNMIDCTTESMPRSLFWIEPGGEPGQGGIDVLV